jgi:hypothetical protein
MFDLLRCVSSWSRVRRPSWAIALVAACARPAGREWCGPLGVMDDVSGFDLALSAAHLNRILPGKQNGRQMRGLRTLPAGEGGRNIVRTQPIACLNR